jgi:hypothetical protein
MEFSFQLKNDGMVESSLECVSSTETEMWREREREREREVSFHVEFVY